MVVVVSRLSSVGNLYYVHDSFHLCCAVDQFTAAAVSNSKLTTKMSRKVLWLALPVCCWLQFIYAAPTEGQTPIFHLYMYVVGWDITTLFVSGLPPASAFYVPSMPELPQDEAYPLHIYSGHIPADPDPPESDSEVTPHLFFVMVKNRRLADRERIMFWFNVRLPRVFGISVLSISLCLDQGGPGCSSFDGLMMENGPWRVDGRTGLRIVQGGWEEYTTMVYGVF